METEQSAEPLSHRQTKGAATDMLNLKPPRHTPTLPISGRPILVFLCRRDATPFLNGFVRAIRSGRWSGETPMRRAKTLSTEPLYQRCSLV